jgi:hypothetical protein
MKQKELDRLKKVGENWRKIADRLDNQPVVMTANSHRLFSNELDAVLSRMSVDTPWYRRIITKIHGTVTQLVE